MQPEVTKKQLVVDYLTTVDEEVIEVGEVIKHTGINGNTVYNIFGDLTKDGKIERIGGGQYKKNVLFCDPEPEPTNDQYMIVNISILIEKNNQKQVRSILEEIADFQDVLDVRLDDISCATLNDLITLIRFKKGVQRERT